jgi:hypothetical protein
MASEASNRRSPYTVPFEGRPPAFPFSSRLARNRTVNRKDQVTSPTSQLESVIRGMSCFILPCPLSVTMFSFSSQTTDPGSVTGDVGQSSHNQLAGVALDEPMDEEYVIKEFSSV